MKLYITYVSKMYAFLGIQLPKRFTFQKEVV
jgi:hypothetical protein